MINKFVEWIECICDHLEVAFNWVKKVFSKKTNTTDFVAEQRAKVDALTQDDQPLRWKIWVTHYDVLGNVVGYGVYPTDYAHKSSAVRRAKKVWDPNPLVKWVVSQTNPWKTAE